MSEALGRIVMDGDRAALVFERILPHPIEKVWVAISEPAELAGWFGEATVDGRTGGTFAFVAGPPHVPVAARRSEGTILVWDPPHVLEYEWNQAIVEASVVRYELTREGDGTRLRFTHKWLSLQNANGFIPGTHAFQDRLAAYLNGESVPDWGARFAEVAPLYGATWSRS